MGHKYLKHIVQCDYVWLINLYKNIDLKLRNV
jgi:hypothetical protein